MSAPSGGGERHTSRPFRSGRSVTLANNGMVATSHPLLPLVSHAVSYYINSRTTQEGRDRHEQPRKREKASSGKAKRDDPLKEATVLIPLTYNDETEVPKGTIEAIFEELFVAFHGWTIEGTVKGAYRMRTG